MGLPEPVQMLDSDLPSMMKRICVRPPYFALEEVQVCDSILTAVARAEMRIDGERGPMTGAELGRHAAIAGICRAALSQNDERRRYYLAQRAECTFEQSDAPFGSEVAFYAELTHLDKRQARSRVTAECAGNALAVFDITYTILTEPAFARLFGTRRQDTVWGLEHFQPQLVGETNRDATSAQFKVADIPAAACAGHFDDFPVLPVAVLMGKLSELAGLTLGSPSVPYRVRRGSVTAKDLCWANEAVTFQVELVDVCASEARFDCSASADDRRVGSMSLVLETS